jgi:hypothetical protein
MLRTTLRKLWGIVRQILAWRALLEWIGWKHGVIVGLLSILTLILAVLKHMPLPISIALAAVVFATISIGWRVCEMWNRPEWETKEREIIVAIGKAHPDFSSGAIRSTDSEDYLTAGQIAFWPSVPRERLEYIEAFTRLQQVTYINGNGKLTVKGWSAFENISESEREAILAKLWQRFGPQN